MRRLIRFVLATLGVLVLWTAVVGFGLLEGWGRSPLAPRRDTQAFMNALVRQVETTRAGNVGIALIENGSVHAEHMSSVGEPVDRDTVFQVASLSKWIAAWGVMALVEQGRFDLDAPISRYLTRWTLPETGFDNDGVTVRRLLSHTAGLTDGLGYAGFAPGAPVQTLEASLTRAADASPGASDRVQVGHPPGEKFDYSGGGYTLLQLLIEEVSGVTFEAYMQRAVFEPLGMHHSTFVWDETRGFKLAPSFDVDSTPTPYLRFTSLAATSLYTTVGDMTTFLQAHLPGARGEPSGAACSRPMPWSRCGSRTRLSWARRSGGWGRCCTPPTAWGGSSSATTATTSRPSTPRCGSTPRPETASSSWRPATTCWPRGWPASGSSGRRATSTS